MFVLPVDEHLTLGLFQPCHAEALSSLQDSNRPRLEPWLDYLKTLHSLDEVRAFIRAGLDRFAAGKGVHTGFWSHGDLAGAGGLRVHEDGYATLGYWLGSEFEGRGLATKAARALAGYGFETLGLHRIEIRCDPANTRSIAVAERAGFVREGILRHAAMVNSEWRDLVVFSRLICDEDRSARR